MTTREAIIAEIPRLRRYARALTGDAAHADDLVQDTLERALSRFFLFRPGNLRAWLFAVMHNVFVNQVQRGPTMMDDELVDDIPVRGAQDDAMDMRDLARCVARLPVEQREALLLVGLEGLSYEEAARVLRIPAGTLMSRLSRGRDKLRALLAGAPMEPARLKVIK